MSNSKLKLTILICALTISQITMADYIARIPLEVSMGGSLPNGSIIFKAPAVDPVIPVEPVDPSSNSWDLFADENGFDKNWNYISISNDLISLPSENYPISSPSTVDFFGNQLSNIGGLKNLVSVDYLDLSRNNLTNLNGMSNLKYVGDFYLSWNNITSLSGLSGLENVVNTFNVKSNNLTNFNGLNNLTTVGSFIADENNISNINGISNLKVLYNIYIDGTYSGPKLAATTRFCLENNSSLFYGLDTVAATKSQLCENP